MAEHARSWIRRRWRTVLLLLIALAVVGSAYSYWLEYTELAARRARESMAPPVGALCTIDFVDSNESVVGRFVMLNDTWIVFNRYFPNMDEFPESKLTKIWIPLENVRKISVEP